MAFYPPRTADPVLALKSIVEQHPRADSQKLLSIFTACVHDSAPLARATIERAFNSACEELRTLNGNGTPR
jgi:hypothetical protein